MNACGVKTCVHPCTTHRSGEDSRTRRVTLAATTREDAAKDFGGLDNVPEEAITMGVATILAARSIVLLALGERKASTIAAALEGPRGPEVPASFLRGHPSARVVLDSGAASALQRRSAWAPPAARHAVARMPRMPRMHQMAHMVVARP